LLDLGAGQRVACHYHDKAAELAPDLLRGEELASPMIQPLAQRR